MAIYEERVNEAICKINKNFDIIDSSREFMKFFNIANTSMKFYDLLLNQDKITFQAFIENFNESNCYFIASIKPRKSLIKCIFYVTKCNDDYSLEIAQLEYTKEVYDDTLIKNALNKALLNNYDIYFFIYDYQSRKFVFRNTKVATDIFTGNKYDFISFVENRFEISEKENINEYTRFERDILLHNDEIDYAIKLYKRVIGIHTKIIKIAKKELMICNLTMGELPYENKVINTEYRDGLTELYSKKYITSLCKDYIQSGDNTGTLVIIDIDNFKECNDNYGHAFGDQVLISMTKILKDAILNQGFIGRIGGDEFLCLIKPTDEENLRNILRNIRLGLQWSIPAMKPDAVVTCSMGCARFPYDGNNYDDIFDLADKCLYIAKKKGRNCYVIFKPEIHNAVITKVELRKKSIACGTEYNNASLMQLEIINIINNKNHNWQINAIKALRNYLNASKITLYDNNFNIISLDGVDDGDIRGEYLKNKPYFDYYNEADYLLMDNVNVLDALDKELYDTYLKYNVSSVLEIKLNDENGAFKGLLCIDIYKPARTFKPEQIIFALMIAKIIL